MQETIDLTHVGWQCPKCKRCYAPTVDHCDCQYQPAHYIPYVPYVPYVPYPYPYPYPTWTITTCSSHT